MLNLELAPENQVSLVHISEEPEVEAINKLVNSSSINILHFRTPEEFICSNARDDAYHGILINIKTKIKLDQYNKEIVHMLEKNSMLICYKISVDGQFCCYIPCAEVDNSFDGVIDYWRTHNPRKIRVQQRYSSYLNINVYPWRETSSTVISTKDFVHMSSSCDSTKTFTLNVSVGGLFIVSMKAFKPGEKLLMDIPQISATPIVGEVRWVRGWNQKSEKIPGMGVSFINLHEDQRKNIEEFISRNKTVVIEGD